MRAGRRNRTFALTILVVLVCCSACTNGPDGARSPDGSRLEVFSWLNGLGEQDGLDALIADFRRTNPAVEVVDAGVTANTSGNARAVLANRLANNDPPDSYHAYVGRSLASDVKAGRLQDLDTVYKEPGLREGFPSRLLDAVTVNGKLYAVPVDVHRANLLWYNPKTLAKAGLSGPPATWDDFLDQAATLELHNIAPLVIGPTWTDEQLLETVLLGKLGPDGYAGLWNGTTDWRSAEVGAALTTYTFIRGHVTTATTTSSWQAAMDKIIDGTAAYVVMSDFADAYLTRVKKLAYKTEYGVVATPGTDGVFDFMADAFVLPKGAPHPDAARRWLAECGSVAGQDAFGPNAGAVPARIDADASKYTNYSATALAAWRNPTTRFVGSLTYGVVANTDFGEAIERAMTTYLLDTNYRGFADAVSTAYQTTVNS
jgi:glucose/mannose transport system substrate-binding protein